MRTYDKDPDARLDYHLDWSHVVEGSDFITTSTWTAQAGITVDASTFEARETIVWLEGGQAGSVYRVTNRITTAQGRVDERSFFIRVKEQ